MSENRDELLDLLIERASVGLSPREEARLAVLLDEEGFSDDGSFELAVAAAWNAFALDEGTVEDSPVPERLKRRLAADADVYFDGGDTVNLVAIAPRKRKARFGASFWFAGSGWALAAVLMIALAVSLTGPPAPASAPARPVPAQERAALLTAPGTVTRGWGRSQVDAYEDVTGDVVWNDAKQSGFMRLVGMPVNDANESQYQLWIVDRDRDAEPVDGGVFDVPAGHNEVIVPIDAKLRVSSPDAFAITREKPGGVVVSEGPLLVVSDG